jgi:hypothetical protein
VIVTTTNAELAALARAEAGRHKARTPQRRAAAALWVALGDTRTLDAARRALDTFGTPADRDGALELLARITADLDHRRPSRHRNGRNHRIMTTLTLVGDDGSEHIPGPLTLEGTNPADPSEKFTIEPVYLLGAVAAVRFTIEHDGERRTADMPIFAALTLAARIQGYADAHEAAGDRFVPGWTVEQ